MRGGLGVGDGLLHIVYKALAQYAADIPDLLVGNLVDAGEAGFVVVVSGELLAKYAGMDLFPLRSGPGGVVDTVGHIAHIHLFREIAGPHACQNLLADLAVEPADAVDTLGHICGQDTHGEFLAAVIYVVAAQTHEGVPVNLHPLGERTEIYTHHILAEEVVTCGNGGVGGKERRAAYHLESLRKGEVVVLYIHPYAFYAGKGSVSLVAVVNLGLDTKGLEGADTAQAQ